MKSSAIIENSDSHGNIWQLRVLYLAFFATGFSALLYQVIWQRLLSLFAGSDTISVAIVVGAFLGGLGVGSLAGSLLADRLTVRKALLTFALCNFGIAAFAVGSKYIFYNILFLQFSSLAISRSMTLVVSFIALLFPTVLMGLSLPVLSRAVVRAIEKAAESITLLYGLNTIGAGFGAILGGWFLAKYLGFEKVLLVGAIINATVGLTICAAFIMLAKRASAGNNASSASRVTGTITNITSHDLRWLILVMLSGFMSISLQVVFFRVFETLFEGRAFTFAVVLCNFLIYDALGALLGSKFLKAIKDPATWFFIIQGLIVFFGMGGIWLLTCKGVDIVFWKSTVWGTVLVLPGIIIGPAALLIGLYFPIVQKAVQTSSNLVGTRTGLIDFGIIMGNTLGSIITGLVFLDVIGTTGTLRVLAAGGLIFLVCAYVKKKNTVLHISLACLMLSLAGFFVLFPVQNKFWTALTNKNLSVNEVVAAEDKSGSALIHRKKTGGDEIYASSMYFHGHEQGKIENYYLVHSFLGSIGPLIHPLPEDILVIGLGSTGTAYAAGADPRCKQIDVVEIAEVMFKVLDAFCNMTKLPFLETVMKSRRFNIIGNDARRFLSITDKKYDIIESDPLLPQTSGSGMLYSTEFFTMVKSKLKKGGFFVQWAPTARVCNGIRRVFPYVIGFHVAPWTHIFIASEEPIPFDTDKLYKRLEQVEVRSYFEQGRVDVSMLKEWTQCGQPLKPLATKDMDNAVLNNVNMDLFPRDEYMQSFKY